MAHVYRPTVTKPIPKSAVIVTVDGKPHARWKPRGGGGRVITAEVIADGTRCRYEGPRYWIAYVDAKGNERIKKGFPDKRATDFEKCRIEREVEDQRAGRTTARTPVPGPEHLVDHITAYRAYLETRDISPDYPREMEQMLDRVVTGARLTTPAAVDGDDVTHYLAGQRKAHGWAASTYNNYVGILRAFGRWLVRKRLATANPFAELARLNPANGRKRIRRVLPDTELASLVVAARNSPRTIKRLPGPDRAILYLLAAYTGFRATSLGRLTPESFVWDAAGRLPTWVYSGRNKNGKPHGVPVHPEVGRELADWLRGRPAGRELFPSRRCPKRGSHEWAEMLRHDLAVAKIPYQDAADHYFDFHSLRVQYASQLAHHGVPLTAAQQLLDHSDPRLTATIYTRWGNPAMAAEVAKLPGLGLPPSVAVLVVADRDESPESRPAGPGAVPARCAKKPGKPQFRRGGAAAFR